jgi:glycosyltransferase involved in cell wall biosynthesis
MRTDEIARVALACAPKPDYHDAILAFTEHLAAALAGRGEIAPALLLRRRTGAWSTADARVEARLYETLQRTGAGELALQYNPFSYGHWGVAPGLLAELISARRRGVLRRLVLVVHEPFVVMPGLRYSIMGAVQRQQLGALMRLADAVLATTETWLPVLGGVRPGMRVGLLPVGSNMPDHRGDRAATRDALRASAETLVVSTFGMTHPHQFVGHVAAAVEVALEDGHEIVFVSLGREPDELPVRHPRLRVVSPGPMEAAELARLLAAADLFLAPYCDGATTRRTSLMAALQHGLCVVTTKGAGRDRALREPALALVPVSDRAAFAARSRALAGDAAARRRYGRAARELYEQHYSWETIATHFVHASAPDDRETRGDIARSADSGPY